MNNYTRKIHDGLPSNMVYRNVAIYDRKVGIYYLQVTYFLFKM